MCRATDASSLRRGARSLLADRGPQRLRQPDRLIRPQPQRVPRGPLNLDRFTTGHIVQPAVGGAVNAPAMPHGIPHGLHRHDVRQRNVAVNQADTQGNRIKI